MYKWPHVWVSTAYLRLLHRDTKLSCCLNTSDLTRMGVPTHPFHGGHSKDQALLPSPPGLSQASESAEGEPRAEPDNWPAAHVRQSQQQLMRQSDPKMLPLTALPLPETEQGLCPGSRQHHMYQ